MGLISQSLRALVPERKMAIAASVPNWSVGVEQRPQWSYDRGAREGYMLDELVYSCVDYRASSIGEPPVTAYRTGSDEKQDEHPAVTLLNKPNPFMGRSRFWGTIGMSLDIGGNAYVEKVRSAAGKVVELWPLRPDRVTVIPSAETFIGGYVYRIGEKEFRMRAADVIHFKTRHPLDDFYGLAPLAVLAGRVDLDVWTRKFTEAFFRNAGVPAGLLNVIKTLTESDREAMRRNFSRIYGGTDGWHKILVLDGGQATYEPMGLPLGASGAAMPELNEINETRILAVYGMTPSLVATMVGSRGSGLAGSNREADETKFWQDTMLPLFKDLDSALTAGLVIDFPDLDRLEHDMSKVKALQEDEDKRHARYLNDYKGGGITFEEFRLACGYPEKPDKPGMLLLPTTMVPTWSDDMLTEPEPMPEPVPALPGNPGSQPQPALNGRSNGAGH